MATMAETTTDKRLDDLRLEMHRGFDGVDQRFGRVEADVRELRAEVKAGFDAVNGRFDAVNARLESMLKLMIGFFATTVGGVFAAVAAKILLHF
jgi:hypothetical protein